MGLIRFEALELLTFLLRSRQHGGVELEPVAAERSEIFKFDKKLVKIFKSQRTR